MQATRFQCRNCGSSKAELVLDLGLQPLVNNLPRVEDLTEPEPYFPLRLMLCETCSLAQLADTVPPVEMFSEYLYFSSFSKTMLEHAHNAAQRYVMEFELGGDSLVVEIASNDGYLLKNFVSAGIRCLGIEPAANIASIACQSGVETLAEFFDEELGKRLAERGACADLILGNNVFAHVPNIVGFIAGLKALLAPKGRIVLEFPYVGDLVDKSEFDTIYHEHVFYFGLSPLVEAFKRQGLLIFDVEHITIHGGSLRIFAGHAGAYVQREHVKRFLEYEASKGITKAEYYRTFSTRVEAIRKELRRLLRTFRAEGKSLAAYGAAAKGSVLLNHIGVGRETLEFVADRSTFKQGRLVPGVHIPIVSPARILEAMPDYLLLLSWNFAEEILAQQWEYRERGGKFIIPLPELRIV